MTDKPKSTARERADERRKKQKEELLELLASGMGLKAACKNVGVHRTTVRTWDKKDSTFSSKLKSAYEEQRISRKEYAEDMIMFHMSKHWQAAAWHLERKYQDEYALNRDKAAPDQDVKRAVQEAISEMDKGL